ncbi:2-(3-amino-3-carboxypropyl)histidine synthase subunit 1-like isoform X1 [Varroa destructor]|uniref:2-(3-amino-3-carboxypropyl)histidine synthase subunit 1 n=2 Tax=Varroa destructor TaxID=109461 RepID=A0A7M7JB63_VARDE|nr:2-(3-amino-3-carboxypropyl)histidine synthase subunit 1-like isoform X1 [Varroa destructor]XP_022649360.1 2-(3-amino-3-carboxypropyl)histidine synthase subunit 1-like isoform X1 [Varroa destructor]XP_022649361.1 2-(3-amino-3-carboxypropyl)histidine synthase subunit 1-like isoform X1 [Varroa destructor]XP_022649362.1 2-(3-amino-3-carboxypropyl)histidine synthase subunit 1-like isoform X1 [Varroa destructor]XP_022649363.1 2-(3-amino-3-carboxypropyl)histidine synthase subunit 1-like isoform X1 
MAAVISSSAFETPNQGVLVPVTQPRVVSKGTPKIIAHRPIGANHIPDEILLCPKLQAAISVLPKNYNFEIHKTVHRIRQLHAGLGGARSVQVALQMPEGLLLFALTIADILEEFSECQTIVFGDVTYGACCIDDLGAKALCVDLLVHYGHSCLIPIERNDSLKVLYVFVDIKIDIHHLKETVKANFSPDMRIGVVSTIQFVASVQALVEQLKNEGFHLFCPQTKPLSPGETLGCTSPRFSDDSDAILYVGDGRFHLEAAMIANHRLKAYKYDPYDKQLTEELYNYEQMLSVRKDAVQKAVDAGTFGIILGTLGRQGSVKVFDELETTIRAKGKILIRLLLSEIFPQKLELFSDVGAWVQTSCPRLSIDWGLAFKTPLLTPYELNVVLQKVEWQKNYPMDFYSRNSLGPWTPNYKPEPPKEQKRSAPQVKSPCVNFCTDCACK